MSRHHPYAGYDEPRGGGGHRRNGSSGRFPTRGASGPSGAWHSRRGGHGGPGQNWENDSSSGRGYGDFGQFEHDAPTSMYTGGRGGKGGRGRGSRGKVKGQMSRGDVDERDLSIDERIQRERPCRTLFVRNVKYETNPMEVREKFDQMGEIKTFFDLISNRGMVFITYYDVRAATMAKEQLQGSEVSGRPIDVHYSLPKDNELERRCDRDKNQATLFLAISGANRAIDDGELNDKFSVYGEIRSIKHFKDSPYQRFIEFWDSRACEAAHDDLVGSQYLGGKLDLKFSWDTGMVPKTRLPRDMRGGDHRGDGHSGGATHYDQEYGYNSRNGASDYGRGPPAHAGHGGGGYRYGDNSYDNGSQLDMGQANPGHPFSTSYGGDYNNASRMQGPSGSNAVNAFNGGVNSFSHMNQDPSHMSFANSSIPNTQSMGNGYPIPNISGESGGSRLNQAQKVQDLLASLTKVGGLAVAPTPEAHPGSQLNPSSAPMSNPGTQSMYGTLGNPAASNSYASTYPTQSSIPENMYRSTSNALLGLSTPASQIPANSPYGQVPNLVNHITVDQTHQPNGSQPSAVASGSLPSVPGAGQLTPAILALLGQASAAATSNTALPDTSNKAILPGQDSAAAYPPSNGFQLPVYGAPTNASATPASNEVPTGPRAMSTVYPATATATTRAPTASGTVGNVQSEAPVNPSPQVAVQQLLALLTPDFVVYDHA
ncbi:uncharacterized protein MELLADRAFT_78947 [Melampsora larici-populina 98AG31]|uniref:RRM domain-containing protein n=1 Tax=Melampsora larici-populina (strain 98AG31 / pathotype 3-4-7) TaxID=747676 RepID=F4S0X9_MELLP|nr:uncharacterized protein MELLADRAFT_78947 [Melampsora larici-populina 98AG31]EGG01666.1 hypothetical protein MELLADRAFT_78947 [Melampsora larici-populina 98AG31]